MAEGETITSGPPPGAEAETNRGLGKRTTAVAKKKKRPPPAAKLTPAQQALAARHVGLVGVHMRNRVRTPREPTRDREYDDLFQEGCVALVRAAARYRRNRDGSFPAYALPRIRGGIFAAIHECFSTIHVPLREAARTRSEDRSLPASQRPLQTIDDKLMLKSPEPGPSNPRTATDSIRHVIRRRFERAVRSGLADLESRTWKRRNPLPIMKRLAAERLLIPDEAERTPLRQIAREAGVSSSRASAYEQNLMETVGRHFAGDPQLRLLIDFARRDPAGFDGPVDEDRRELLSHAQLEAFENQFEGLEQQARAELMYTLIERSGAVVPEVARNLYLLTLSHSDAAIPLAS